MSSASSNELGLRSWLDRQDAPNWPPMPLTHIAKGAAAESIVKNERIKVNYYKEFKRNIAYLFYGRPSYKVRGDGSIKVEATSPHCFIFDSSIINKSFAIYAFDTGAFHAKKYAHILIDEMKFDDFSLGIDINRINKLIMSVFTSRRSYFYGDLTHARSTTRMPEPWEYHARAYLDLITSTSRNELDERVSAIEVLFDQEILLGKNLKAVIVPHTEWYGNKNAPWLIKLYNAGVEILTYDFFPGRHPDYYHALIELQVRLLYERWGVI